VKNASLRDNSYGFPTEEDRRDILGHQTIAVSFGGSVGHREEDSETGKAVNFDSMGSSNGK